MRTTLNLDDDLVQKLKREAGRSRTSLTATVNRVLRDAMERLQPDAVRHPYRCPTFSMGFPPVANLDKALQLAASLGDDEVVHKLGLHK